MFAFILAVSLVANPPEVVVESDAKNLSESQVELEEMLDSLDEEEVVFEDLELFSEDENDLDTE